MFPHLQHLNMIPLQLFMKHRNTSSSTTRQSSRKTTLSSSQLSMVLMNGEDIILVKPDGTWHTIILSGGMEQLFKRGLMASAPCTLETIQLTCNLWLLFLQETLNWNNRRSGKSKPSKKSSLNFLVNMASHARTSSDTKKLRQMHVQAKTCQ